MLNYIWSGLIFLSLGFALVAWSAAFVGLLAHPIIQTRSNKDGVG